MLQITIKITVFNFVLKFMYGTLYESYSTPNVKTAKWTFDHTSVIYMLNCFMALQNLGLCFGFAEESYLVQCYSVMNLGKVTKQSP